MFTLVKVEVMEGFMIEKNIKKKCENFFFFLRWFDFKSNNPNTFGLY